MSLKIFLKLIVAALGATVAIRFNGYLLDKQVSLLAALLASATTCAVFIHLVQFMILDLPMYCKPMRRCIDPRAKLEGLWFIQVDNLPERPYSLAKIEYIPGSKSFLYTGTAYDVRGIAMTKWKSKDLTFDLSVHEMRFLYEAWMLDESGDFVKAAGIATFDKNSRGTYVRADGYFVDFGPNVIKRQFHSEKVNRKDLLAHLGKRHISSGDDVNALLLSYRNRLKTSNETS